MKHLQKILPLFFLMLIISSCKKDFLNTVPADKYSDELLWKDPNLIRPYVNGIYQKIHNPFGTLWLSSFVDETMTQGFWGLSSINSSLLSASDLGALDANHWGQTMRPLSWEKAYNNIRACNLFFENIDKATYGSQAEKDQIVGEVTFLRAYIYHWLVALHGGVPLITRSYSATDNFEVARNTYAECIDFIVSECNKSVALLQLSGDKVRATKGAALSLKSRTLLYAASDFANSNASWAGGYAKKELVGYVGGDRTARWQAAKAAAKAVIDLNKYSLYNPNPASTADAIKGYQDIFLTYDTNEDIFQITYDYQNGGWPFTYMGQSNSPNGWHGWGGQGPVGQMVDAYEMNDGSKFSWSNPAHKAAPYINRDPRLAASILYDGAYYKERPLDVRAADPLGRVQTGFYKQADGSYKGGLDTKDGIDNWNAMPTGYYLRKFIDPKVEITAGIPQKLPWKAFRYAEIILNYVEACIELGEDAEARLYLNKIRTRAGMPAITLSGQALKDEYRYERRVELAFEQHRFFDVRRWMIASGAYTNAEGILITYDLLPGGQYASPVYSKNTTTWENRNFKNNFYLLPITISEMNRNPKLIQNPLY